jgi:predicted nucleic acid-binding protein
MVVDASVWVSRLLPQDAKHAATRGWLERHLRDGGLTASPALALAEVAGAVARRTGSARLGTRAVQALLDLPGLRLIAVDQRLAMRAARLAAELSLRGADAVYVAAALDLGLPLVSWDVEQRERGRRLVRVHTPGEME